MRKKNILSFILCILISTSNIYSFTGGEKTVKIITVPDSADVYLDGIYVCRSGVEFSATMGIHKIKLVKESCLTLEATINVLDKAQNVFNFSLTRKAGILELTVFPSDAGVSIDDSAFSSSDLSEIILAPGFHKVLIEKEGFFAETDTFSLPVQARLKKNYSLVRLPDINLAQSEKKAELNYIDNTILTCLADGSQRPASGGSYTLKIRDDVSVLPEYRSTPKIFSWKVKKEQNNLILSFEDRIELHSEKNSAIINRGDSLKADPFYLTVNSAGFNNIADPNEAAADREFTVLLRPRSKTKIMLESMLVPGLGQFNNGRKTVGAVIAGAFFGALIWDVINISDYNSSKNQLSSKIDSYKNENNFTLKHQKASEINLLYAELSPKYRLAQRSHIITGAVYLINIIDAFFSSSPLKEAILTNSGSVSINF